MSTPSDLAGLGALVTGGGSGIGLGIASRLAADGATVTICGRTESRLLEAIESVGTIDGPGSLHAVVADVTDEAAVVAAVAAAEANAGGPLGAVVANAGGSTSIGPITQLDEAAWAETLALNLTGTMLALKHGAASLVRGGGGSFVAVSSTAGSLTHPWFGAYGPSKAAIDQLCRQAADELGPSDVRVNAICPGFVATDMARALTDRNEALMTSPDDLARIILMLVSLPNEASVAEFAINCQLEESF